MNKDVLDTVVSAETPEGIAIELRPAGLSSRCFAYLVDLLIRFGVIYAVAIATTLMGGFGLGLLLILAFALEWFYPVVFELSRWGATPAALFASVASPEVCVTALTAAGQKDASRAHQGIRPKA